MTTTCYNDEQSYGSGLWTFHHHASHGNHLCFPFPKLNGQTPICLSRDFAITALYVIKSGFKVYNYTLAVRARDTNRKKIHRKAEDVPRDFMFMRVSWEWAAWWVCSALITIVRTVYFFILSCWLSFGSDQLETSDNMEISSLPLRFYLVGREV